MTTNDDLYQNIQSAYNKYTLLPKVSYNIATYLMNNTNAELIWRLLYYTTNDAWNINIHPNLTKAQKGALIYKGDGMVNDYRVFFDAGMDNAWTTSNAMLRISPVTLDPTTYVYGIQCIRFEVYSHSTISMLSDYTARSLSIVQKLIEVLNGAEIDGIGQLFFNKKASNYCRVTGINIGNATYKGYELIMCNQNF